MRIIYYLLESFDGDYANLMDIDNPQNPLNPVAIALLPEQIRVGSKLKWELFEYTLEQF